MSVLVQLLPAGQTPPSLPRPPRMMLPSNPGYMAAGNCATRDAANMPAFIEVSAPLTAPPSSAARTNGSKEMLLFQKLPLKCRPIQSSCETHSQLPKLKCLCSTSGHNHTDSIHSSAVTAAKSDTCRIYVRAQPMHVVHCNEVTAAKTETF